MSPSVSDRPIETAIRTKLEAAFLPVELRVMNESYMHSVPPNSETHFKVVVVGAAFEGKSLVMRHRAVNKALAEELSAGLHALSIEALTPTQWAEREGAVMASPECRGGSKAG
jgi:BolA protein